MQKNYFRKGCTKLETVSELFRVEDSKSNHQQKHASYLKKNSAKGTLANKFCHI